MSRWQDERPTRTPGLGAKDEILARVRAALAVPRRDAVTEAEDVPRTYMRADDKQETATDPAKIRAALVDRLRDYTATVLSATEATLPAVIAEALGTSTRVVIPPGVPEEWTAATDAHVTRDDGTLTPRDLDGFDAVLTGCHTAIALTGTVVLRSDELGGRRVLSLIPDLHVVVVRHDQVVAGVPKAIQRLSEDAAASWTMISGPSATSDIELDRVEGVHGPRTLIVVLVSPEQEELST